MATSVGVGTEVGIGDNSGMTVGVAVCAGADVGVGVKTGEESGADVGIDAATEAAVGAGAEVGPGVGSLSVQATDANVRAARNTAELTIRESMFDLIIGTGSSPSCRRCRQYGTILPILGEH